MSSVLEFLPEAVCDAEEAARFYERRVAGLGHRFNAESESVYAAIVRQPMSWRERPGGYRRVNLPGFPFYLAFFIRGERVLVAAVGHASRHPDYWKRRDI